MTKKHDEIIAKKGDKVFVDYTGTFDDGTVFDSSTHGDHSHPLEFEAGEGKVIKGFDDAIIGMKVGEEKTIRLEPADAYGDADPRLVDELPREHIPIKEELKAGMVLKVQLPNGMQMPANITKVTDSHVTIDLNHPMAGKVLNFKLKLTGINK